MVWYFDPFQLNSFYIYIPSSFVLLLVPELTCQTSLLSLTIFLWPVMIKEAILHKAGDEFGYWKSFTVY
jgi:hypothetical protein